MSPGISRNVPDPVPQMEPLTVEEYQRVLAVLRRDAVLRLHERQRISQLRSSLKTEGEDVGCPQCETSTSERNCSVCVRRRDLKLQSGDWFYRHLQSRFFRTANITENNIAQENGAAMDPDSAQVREFIERLVEALVSGQLDDVKVNRVYTHPEYKPLPEEETPSAVHAALKQRVQRIIEEAMTLPNLKSQVPMQNGTAFHKWDDDITSMTYEDILATAILNKVIEQFQQKTGVVLAPSRMEQAPKYISRVEIGVNNHDDDDSSSQEGLRSWSDSSHTEPLSMTIEECIEEEVTVCDSAGEEEGDGISDGMATTSSELDFYLSGLNFIKQQRVPFPELGVDIVDGAKEEDYDEDEHSDSSQSPHPTDLVSPMNSWEENWLFQRRRLKAGGVTGSVKRAPMPVPMLVPNPSEDFKARIGDRDAEEVSDLSDCSDGALEDVVLAGVETELTDFHLPKVSVTNAQHDDASQLGSKESIAGLSAALATDGSIGTELIEATNVNLVKASSVECLSEFGQQDSEYTEDYASVAQRQLDSLTEQIVPTEHLALAPVPKPRTLPMPAEPSKSSPNQEMWTDTKNDTELSSPPQPGTIAEREHRKWESAPPLPNNPYSTENISRRLSSKSAGFSSLSSSTISVDFPELNAESRVTSPLQVICTSGELDYKRYGRDYYINHSKLASGERYSSSRLNSPLLQQRSVDVMINKMEADQISGADTHDTDEIYGYVENEIAKWQKEINQTEEQWLRKMQHNGSVESTVSQNGCGEMQPANSEWEAETQAAKSKVIEVGKWRNSDYMAPSEGSTVSSDLDFDADVPVVLPSVKELAKHFSAGKTSDSDSSVARVLPKPRQSKMVEVPKEVVIVAREKQPQPVREVHSLTARSMSREFREGLRRNLPTQLDSILHVPVDATTSNGTEDSSCSSPKPCVINRTGDMKISPANLSKVVESARNINIGGLDKLLNEPKCNSIREISEGDLVMMGDDSTPGYMSDESGTHSPTPSRRGRHRLQNNIAFWEQWHHK
ncbi:uncharacterized protein LOC110834013 isoform X6 [Zootermopsis nevadensis]|uniref:uncharacterized protein LOC110834013 isoform X6 n=1 Tax=Zootermopsis nevadensis TaxID=136037 RepID=UPI000B8EA0FB|nr:uncharacterized protein LOC110834013 isoform X6 [Zootermopsis nevadensis]